jgi:hypothetical protein
MPPTRLIPEKKAVLVWPDDELEQARSAGDGDTEPQLQTLMVAASFFRQYVAPGTFVEPLSWD